MKWRPEQISELKDLCMVGTSNKDLAIHFSVPVTEIHAKRSQLGITIPKCRAVQGKLPITVNPELENALAGLGRKPSPPKNH